MLVIAIFLSEKQCSFKQLTCTCIPSQINQTTNLEAISFYGWHFQTAEEQFSLVFGFFLLIILVGVVNYEAKCSRVSAIEFDGFVVLESACPIQVGVNEGLHGVKVQDQFSNLIR